MWSMAVLLFDLVLEAPYFSTRVLPWGSPRIYIIIESPLYIALFTPDLRGRPIHIS